MRRLSTEWEWPSSRRILVAPREPMRPDGQKATLIVVLPEKARSEERASQRA